MMRLRNIIISCNYGYGGTEELIKENGVLKGKVKNYEETDDEDPNVWGFDCPYCDDAHPTRYHYEQCKETS